MKCPKKVDLPFLLFSNDPMKEQLNWGLLGVGWHPSSYVVNLGGSLKIINSFDSKARCLESWVGIKEYEMGKFKLCKTHFKIIYKSTVLLCK